MDFEIFSKIKHTRTFTIWYADLTLKKRELTMLGLQEITMSFNSQETLVLQSKFVRRGDMNI